MGRQRSLLVFFVRRAPSGAIDALFISRSDATRLFQHSLAPAIDGKLRLWRVSTLEPFEREVQVVDSHGIQSHLSVLVRVTEHDQLSNHRHSTRKFWRNLHRKRHRNRHIKSFLLVSHPRHLSLQLSERRAQVGDALLRLSQLFSLPFDNLIRPFRRSFLQFLHRRFQIRHLLFAQTQRRERVSHRRARLG